MPYCLRLMGKQDLAQVIEIDREAFPTQWPSLNFHHELQNRLAHYIVAYDTEKSIAQPVVEASPERKPTGLASKWRRLFGLNRFFNNEPLTSTCDYIVGFVGFWVIADEAHITSIAVREAYRRRGIGELLLVSVFNRAIELKASLVTLEVRASNTAAQNLYTKYGFTQTRVRPGYYVDNRENALVMAVGNITSAAFQTHFQQLKQSHSTKWGRALDQ